MNISPDCYFWETEQKLIYNNYNNYNNRDGWKKYYNVSDKYAKPIIRLVRIFKDKNELQREFKK